MQPPADEPFTLMALAQMHNDGRLPNAPQMEDAPSGKLSDR
jgi:hypothetical protein